MMVLSLGIDVGGTKIAGGRVDTGKGMLSHRMEVPTRPERGGAAVLADVAAMARDLAGPSGRFATLGIGVPELVSPDGRVFSAQSFDWTGLDVAAAFDGQSPARMVSDVHAAASAEARFGAGRGHGHMLYVSIGTGISSALVIDGAPYAGSRGAALVMASGLTTCPDSGVTYSLEDHASGPGLLARANRERADAFASTRDVIAAAVGGDDHARRVIDSGATALGSALALLAGALDPSLLVLGGGLGSVDGPYFEAIARETRRHLWAGDRRDLKIVRAALGPDAGIIGAAAMGAGTVLRANLPDPGSS